MTTLKRAWQRLTRAAPGKTQAELAGKYTHSQALLSAGNQVLTLMADMEENLSGGYLFDLHNIRPAISQFHQETAKLVDALNGLGCNRYGTLAEAPDRINREVEEVLTRRREIPAAPLMMDFEALNASMAGMMGGKNANLGEVKNRVGRRVPGSGRQSRTSSDPGSAPRGHPQPHGIESPAAGKPHRGSPGQVFPGTDGRMSDEPRQVDFVYQSTGHLVGFR